MQYIFKRVKFAGKFVLAVLLVGALLACGCSGINAGGSISPGMFLIPGLMKNDTGTNSTPSQKIARYSTGKDLKNNSSIFLALKDQ